MLKRAIYDEAAFELVVRDIHEPVTALHGPLPIPNKELDKRVLNDLKTV
jgi:hypothetical protein